MFCGSVNTTPSTRAGTGCRSQRWRGGRTEGTRAPGARVQLWQTSRTSAIPNTGSRVLPHAVLCTSAQPHCLPSVGFAIETPSTLLVPNARPLLTRDHAPFLPPRPPPITPPIHLIRSNSELDGMHMLFRVMWSTTGAGCLRSASFPAYDPPPFHIHNLADKMHLSVPKIPALCLHRRPRPPSNHQQRSTRGPVRLCRHGTPKSWSLESRVRSSSRTDHYLSVSPEREEGFRRSERATASA